MVDEAEKEKERKRERERELLGEFINNYPLYSRLCCDLLN